MMPLLRARYEKPLIEGRMTLEDAVQAFLRTLS
jgi:hypothetical protein